LRESAQDDHIEAEYRHAETTTDIYLKWQGIFSSDEVLIELKRASTSVHRMDLRNAPKLSISFVTAPKFP